MDILNWIASGLFFGFSCYTAWSVFPGSSLFSWHPTFMIFGQFLALEGVFFFRLPSKKWKITVHWILEGIGLALFLLGFGAIYIHKNNESKQHFVSTHGQIGILTLAFIILEICGGVILKYLKKMPWFPISKKTFKFYHVWSGFLGLVLPLCTVLLATEKKLHYVLIVILPFSIFIGNKLTAKKNKNKKLGDKKDKKEKLSDKKDEREKISVENNKNVELSVENDKKK